MGSLAMIELLANRIMKNNTSHHLHLFSAYTNKCGFLLSYDKYKSIVAEQLHSFSEENNISLRAFVIMPGYFHIIWEIRLQDKIDLLQLGFLKRITKCIVYDLQKNHPVILPRQKKYSQAIEIFFWKHSINDLIPVDDNIFKQKLNYIHNVPVKAGLCSKPELYKYSSAQYYQTGEKKFNGF